jgi:hypothetical protein
MADSIRQKIVDLVLTRFKGILVSGGYETNLGQQVFGWRDTANKPFAETELPAINIRDVRDTIQPQTAQIWHHQLEVQADIIAASGVTTAQDIRKMLADVYKAIGVDRFWTDGGGIKRAFNTEPKTDESALEQENKIIGGARINFVIHYRTKSFDAYNHQ